MNKSVIVNGLSPLANDVLYSDWKPRIFSSQQLNDMKASNAREVWMLASYREVMERLGHEFFPCPFAKKSAKRSSQWFAFMECFAVESLRYVRSSLLEYLRISENTEPASQLLMPFVVLVNPDAVPETLAACHREGWKVLQYLHDHDVYEWPKAVPRDPEQYLWSFCFRGVQLFVNFSSPRYAYHRSRNLGSSMAFVINPRQNFDKVAGNTPEGHAVRKRIRERVEIYEGHPPPAELGTYGQASNREWRQYAIGESGAPLPERCPLKIRKRS